MRSIVIVAFLCSPLGILGFVRNTKVNNGKLITCNRATVKRVKIGECPQEPCQVAKGEEIPVEIDFIFQTPRSTNDVELTAFAPYWILPGAGDFGSNLVQEKSCSALRIRPCPAPSDKRLTLKTYLYVDPELRKSVGEENGVDNEVTTAWSLKFHGRHESRSSDCSFSVRLNFGDDAQETYQRIFT